MRVATSDMAEQMIVLGHGARRMTAAELRIEVDEAEKRLRGTLEAWNARERDRYVNRPLKALENRRQGEK